MLDESERRLLAAAPNIFGDATRSQATDELISLAMEREANLGLSVAAALLASLALSEMDAIQEVRSVLAGAFAKVANRHGSLSRLEVSTKLMQAEHGEIDLGSEDLRLLAAAEADLEEAHDCLLLGAAIKQQEAMRLAEFGIDYAAVRDSARVLLDAVDSKKVSRFEQSRGAKWGPVTTVRKVRELLIDANQDLADRTVGFPDETTLRRRLRREPSAIAAASLRDASAGSGAYVKEAFSRFTMSTERTFGKEDPVDAPVWRALTIFELSGHYRHALRHRMLLGQLRMMRGSNRFKDGLRLLRQSGDIKSVNLALNHIRGEGPLEILELEVREILGSRLAPDLLRDVELAVIAGGAQTLDLETARIALSGVLAAESRPTVAPGSRFQLISVRIEQLVKVVVALAPVASENDKLADWLLDAIRSVGPTDDELLARAYGRGVSAIEWGELDEDRRNRWASWMSDPDLTGGWSAVIDQLSPLFGTVRDEIDTEAGSLTAAQIANELNAVMSGSEAPSWLLDQAEPQIGLALERARAETATGRYSFSTTDTADLAAALCLHLGASLWTTLVGYLTDPLIPRSFKAAAMNRLAASPEFVPAHVRDELERKSDGLTAVPALPVLFEQPEIEPFPAAVRLLGSLQIWSSQRVAIAVARLGAGDERARLEAGRTVATLMRTLSPVPEWLVFAALQLSADQSANVRAATGRALGIGAGRAEFAAELLTERLDELLSEDGILVPLLVLRGLAVDVGNIPEAVLGQVADVAANHRVHGVREQAAYVLNATRSS